MNVLTRRRRRGAPPAPAGAVTPPPAPARDHAPGPPEGTIAIAEVVHRTRVRVAGRIRSVRIQPWAGVATLECTLVDATGGVIVVFLGRREIAGLRPGVHMVVEGMVGETRGTLAVLNPDYDFLTD